MVVPPENIITVKRGLGPEFKPSFRAHSREEKQLWERWKGELFQHGKPPDQETKTTLNWKRTKTM